MKYNGIIKKSRTYDSVALSTAIDAMLPIMAMYSPEQLGVTIPVYFAVRLGLNFIQGFLRAKTTGPVGQKDVG